MCAITWSSVLLWEDIQSDPKNKKVIRLQRLFHIYKQLEWPIWGGMDSNLEPTENQVLSYLMTWPSLQGWPRTLPNLELPVSSLTSRPHRNAFVF